MALCFDAESNKYEYCTSHLSTYIAVGVIIPLAIVLIMALVYVYFRCRQRQLRREHQQTYMATIIPIYNSDSNHRVSYNYPYPPHYTSMLVDGFDKPPPYEQTVQEISETNTVNTDLVEDLHRIPPNTTPTPSLQEPIESTRNQF